MDIIVKTDHGRICGRQQDNLNIFLGIPYARPPVGGLRFKSPQESDNLDGVRPATQLAKNPIQPQRSGDGSDLSEDCLYLNIWAPETTEPQPVMVWFPGGAYWIGGAADPIYDGELLAQSTGCVIVTVSYRLNIFGYLDLSMFDPMFEANLGLQDQIAALRWIRQNMAAFGGDPENVTIFGESAGGSAVLTLMCAPQAEPLFHKAIAQSPAVEATYTPDEQALVSGKFLEFAGLDPNRIRDILLLGYDDLMEAGRKLTRYCEQIWPGHCTFRTVVDGKTLPVLPSQAAAKLPDKPLIIGTNRHEATLFLKRYKREQLQQLYGDQGAYRDYPKDVRQALYAAYPGFPARSACTAIATDYMFTEPVLRFADDYSRHSPVFVYRLDFYSPMLGLSGLKAMHSEDVFVLFGHEQSLGKVVYGGSRKTVRAIGQRLRQYWGEFARTGLAGWPSYSAESANTLILGRRDRVTKHPHQSKRDVWRPIGKL